MGTPYVTELVRRLSPDDPGVTCQLVGGGPARIEWRVVGVDHPIVLLVDEPDLAAAVRELGLSVRDALWPDESVDTAGFNILRVHLAEVLMTRDTSRPLRIDDRGLRWPTALRPGYP